MAEASGHRWAPEVAHAGDGEASEQPASALANGDATTSIWVEMISPIWRYPTNPHLERIYLVRDEPNPLILEPNNRSSGTNPGYPG